jgi:uncharacterized protein (DUF2147 family)
MKRLLAVFSLVSIIMIVPSASAQKPDAIVGTWWNQEKDAQIEIYPCEAKYCGKIIMLKEPNFPADDAKGMAGKPKVDRENPDASQRDRPILGMNIVWGFTHSGENLWDGGFIYNPREGKTYKCKLSFENPETLKVRGFIGISLIGKTNLWTRVR